MLSMYAYRNHPPEGWQINGRNILPPNAYTNDKYWLLYLAGIFPKLKQRLNINILTAERIEQLTFAAIEILNKKFAGGIDGIKH